MFYVCGAVAQTQTKMKEALKLIGKHILIQMEKAGPGGFISCEDLLEIIQRSIQENDGIEFKENPNTPHIDYLSERYKKITK